MEVVEILNKLANYNLIRLKKVSGAYYTMYCPFHNDGKERRPSFGVLLESQTRNGQYYPAGFAHCFTCGYAATLPKFIKDLLQQNSLTAEVRADIESSLDTPLDYEFDYLVPKELMNNLDSKFAVSYIQTQLYQQSNYVPESELAQYRYTVPYMYERKMTDEVIDKFDVGVDMKWVPPGRKREVPCITFPVRDRLGHTLFICRRSIAGKLFSLPTDIQKPVYGLYELSPTAKSVVICESCINAITATVYGYDAVALLGTGTPYQMQQLRELGVSDFVICTDGDEAGHKSANRIKRALSQVAMVWTIPMPEGKDLNDLSSKEEFDELYRRRE